MSLERRWLSRINFAIDNSDFLSYTGTVSTTAVIFGTPFHSFFRHRSDVMFYGQNPNPMRSGMLLTVENVDRNTGLNDKVLFDRRVS